MTAPVYIAPLDGVSAGMALVLDGDEGHHAATVRRTRVGERIDVVDDAFRIAPRAGDLQCTQCESRAAVITHGQVGLVFVRIDTRLGVALMSTSLLAILISLQAAMT